MAGIFHVEFGINETALTQALEENDYVTARQLIVSNAHTSFLDEGWYQRTPLFIVLSGRDEANQPRQVNLHMARILVEHGACVNYRMPERNTWCEFMGPGKNALELVTDLYNLLTLHESHATLAQACGEDVTSKSSCVVSMNNEALTEQEDIVEELLEVIFIMLNHGGNPRILNECHMNLMHRTVIFSADPRLLHMLCQNGGGLNYQNTRGSTPLCSLCDPFPLGVKEVTCTGDIDPYVTCSGLNGKEKFVDILASEKFVELDTADKEGRTALFYCMVRGSMQCAETLLRLGSDPTLKASVHAPCGETRLVSPLFATLFSQAVIQNHRDKYTANRVASLEFVAPLVKAGYFDKADIIKELECFLDEFSPDLGHLRQLGLRLLHCVFGDVNLSLTQACSRKLFQFIFLADPLPSSLLGTCPHAMEELRHPAAWQSYLEQEVTTSTLECLIERFRLPSDTLLYLQVELFRQRLCSRLRLFSWFRFYDPDIDAEFIDCVDSEASYDTEGDSDLEYW